MTSAPLERAEVDGACVPAPARWLALAGMVTMPMLRLKVGSGFTPSEVLILCAAYLLALYPGRQRVTIGPPWIAGITAVVVAGEIATANALDPYLSEIAIVRLGLLLLVGYWVAARCLRSAHALAEWMAAYCVGSAISAAFSINQAIGGLDPDAPIPGRSQGLTDHPNDAGASLAVGLIFALALIGGGNDQDRSEVGRWTRRSLVLCIGLMATGLILSGSVTGMISAAVGILALGLTGRIRWHTLMLGVALVLTATFAASLLQNQLGLRALPLSPSDRVFAATGGQGQASNTLAARVKTDYGAWQEIVRAPLGGVGLDARSGVVVDGLAAHNVALVFWYQAGLVAALGLGLLTATALREWMRTSDRLVRSGIGAASLAMFTFGVTAPVFNQLYFWLPLTILGAQRTYVSGRVLRSRFR